MSLIMEQKQGNARLVLKLVRESPLSRAELSRKTGLTRAAITGIVDSLVSEGLLREGTTEKTSMGRRPTMLELVPEAYYSVGIDIARDGVRLCVLDFTMQAVFERFWGNEIESETVLFEMGETVLTLKKQYRFLGAGVVSPGPVDSVNGKILEPDGLDAWHNFSIDRLSELFELDVILQKDTAALAIAEKRFIGADKSFLVLLADHGLGSGFIYKGELFESAFGFGSEIGHISIDLNGEKCSCGNRGCAELYASIPSALKAARAFKPDIIWSELAQSDDDRYRKILKKQAEALALVCVNAINMLEPEVIVLEGDLCLGYELFKENIESIISERCFTKAGRGVKIISSVLGQNARAFSAANLVYEKYFGR